MRTAERAEGRQFEPYLGRLMAVGGEEFQACLETVSRAPTRDSLSHAGHLSTPLLLGSDWLVLVTVPH